MDMNPCARTAAGPTNDHILKRIASLAFFLALSFPTSMALHIGNSGCSTPAQLLSIRSPRHDPDPRCPTSQSRLAVRNAFDSHVARAKRASSRTGRLESRNRKGGLTAAPQEEDQVKKMRPFPEDGGGGDSFAAADSDDGYFLPELPGDKPDFWEGPQWNAFGFFIQYQWAFGIGFASLTTKGGFCQVCRLWNHATSKHDDDYVATYNEGATDFKQTTVYKESIQSRELLDQPEASNSDVFEGNPTEEAPSLE